MDAKRFLCRFFVSFEFPAGGRMVVVAANLPQTKNLKKPLKLKLSSIKVYGSLKCEKSIRNTLEVLQRLFDVKKALLRQTWLS